MSDEHHGIGVRATHWRVGHNRETWEWLLRAMRDVGIRPAGYTIGVHATLARPGTLYECSFGVVGDPQEAKRKIAELWENERPGCGLEIDILY